MKRVRTLPVVGGLTIALLVGQGIMVGSLAAAKGNPANGKKVYEQNCATCHGVKGLGDGPAGKASNPKARNFAHDKFKLGTTVAALTHAVENGSPGTTMVAWKNSLKPDQIADVVAYIRGLIPKANLDKRPTK